MERWAERSKHEPLAPPVPGVLDLTSQSAVQTAQVGVRLGGLLQPGDLILLLGDLGVGKTALAKAIVQGLGSTDLVTSPSFVLVNEYQAAGRWPGLRIHHVDLYRIGDAAEVVGIGLPELWSGQDICLVEWAERAADWLPAEHLRIELRYLAGEARGLRLVPQGARYQHLLAAYAAAVGGPQAPGPLQQARREP